MTSIVAIDIESTGLDKDRDSIIEIGAVRFNGKRVEDEFSTLVNPGKHIPDFITGLTGIDDSMVRNAPRLQDIVHELAAFVADAPVIGHNVRFDLGFLQKANVLNLNRVIDTYVLASILMPAASRYNLGALGQQLGILLPATHRALDDARVTHAVYERLAEMARSLPLEVAQEIVHHGEPLDWDGGYFFEQVLRGKAKEGVQAKKSRGKSASALEGSDDEGQGKFPPLKKVEEGKVIPLYDEEVASILEYGGPFANYFETYEHRPEQVAMLKSVTNALSYGRHMLIEAGTGVGKCLIRDTWVIFRSGERKQIGDIVESKITPVEPIACVSKNGKLTYQKIQAIHNNGVREVWALRTGLGRKIKATGNHSFLTYDGWRTLSELKIGDRIATIRRLPTGNLSFPAHEAFMTGVMLGDGGCTHPDSLSFTNFDMEVVETVRQNVEKLGNVEMTIRKAAGHYGFRRTSLIGHERSGLNLLLEKLDILGHGAATKRIPAIYFQCAEETICHLLAGLWVTDGSVESQRGNITIASASEQLITDIQHLLLRLGIISRVRYKSALLNEKRFDSWSLAILDIQSKRLFWQTVGKYMVGRRKQRLDAWIEAHNESKYNTNDDLFPVEAWRYIEREKDAAGKSWYALRNACVVSSDRQREISRNKMLAIGEFLDSPSITEAATSDLYWDRVVSIEVTGEEETFDLSMEGEPNFIANDIVVHNSFAYLVPAALFALQNNTRVVVSTNTINLQDQLIKKDIPALKEALGLDLRAAVLKGRANYLCPRRLQNMRHFGPNSAEEMRVLAKVLVWQLENQSGDRNELNLTGPAERDAWVKLSAEDDACTTETCAARMAGACAFHRAKTAAQHAHILIVNHALLLSDVATGSKVLPEYDYLIVDEAHHLESATTNALSFKLTQFDMIRMLKEIGNQSSGLLGRLIGAVGDSLRPSDRAAFGQMIERAVSQSFRLEQMNREFFNVLAEFAAFLREGQPQSNYAWQARILPPTRKLTEWEEVEMMWGQMSETWRHLLKTMEGLYKAAADLYSDGNEEVEAPMGNLSNVLRRMTEAHNNLTGLILDPSAATVYWIEVNPKGDRLSLNAAPLHVGNLITEHIWNTKNAVVLASATLTTHGEFTYLRNRLGAEMADELALGSPFDYESSTLLYIGNDMPEPNQPNYEQMLSRAIVGTAKATGGRMLVLFTSYAALKRAAQGITAPLARENIFVLEQGEGASANTLLESFKSTERAVLLGTKSFWEGVDVPGDALQVVVITKLPFDVPTDPLIAARSETYEDPFNEYYLPEAILKFRQGFGRLIRTQSDRGVVVILDKRVMTKQYGRLFLESLPQCTVRAASVANLPKEAGKWLG